MAFPYHWLIRPTQEELREVFRENRGTVLRYSAPLDSPVGRLSYHAVYDKDTYGLEDLGKRTRKNTVRALRAFAVEPMPLERVTKEGWELRQDTASRQGRSVISTGEDWRKKWLAARDLPGFQAWGAFLEGELAALAITFQMDDCYYVLAHVSRSRYLTRNVNNALIFTATESIVRQGQARSILYGMESPDAPASVDEFKFHMGARAKPVRQCCLFHPLLSPFVNKLSHALVRFAASLGPGDVRLSLAEGIMRFCLEGSVPISQQIPPVALREVSAKAAE